MREVTIERCKGKAIVSQATHQHDVGGDVELVRCNVRDNSVDYDVAEVSGLSPVPSRITVDGKVAQA
jgi:hypothetical protein